MFTDQLTHLQMTTNRVTKYASSRRSVYRIARCNIHRTHNTNVSIYATAGEIIYTAVSAATIATFREHLLVHSRDKHHVVHPPRQVWLPGQKAQPTCQTYTNKR